MRPPSWNRSTDSRRESTDRAQMGPIGLTLVFGFVLVGSILVIAFGLSALSGTEDTLNEDRAEKTLTQFDSKAALVALGNTDSQKVSFPSGSTEYEVREGDGWMKVTINNISNSKSGKTMVNQSMGSIVYETEGGEIAYQGGGVWRSTSNNTRMVSPPEFHFRNGTLTLPAVNVTGDDSLSNSATIRHEETIGNVSKLPGSEYSRNEFTNPLTNHEVKVIVQSDYYKGWGSYFEERTEGEVAYNHERKIANLTLKSPVGKRIVSNAIAATATGGNFDISGNGAKTDSYNSSQGPYSLTQGDNGNITIGGSFEASGGAQVDGNVKAGGDFSITGNTEVNGDVKTGGDFTCSSGSSRVYGDLVYAGTAATRKFCPDGSQETGSVEVEGESPINNLVESTVTEAETSNDNAGTPADGHAIDFTSNTATLTAGTYHVDRLEVDDGETLFLDTSGGTVTITVDEYALLDGDASIEILGDGRAEVYVRGEATVDGTNHFKLANQGSSTPAIKTPGPAENSSQFWVYGKDDLHVEIQGSGGGQSSRFVGVIYAPAGSSGTSTAYMSAGEVFGGVIVGDAEVDQGGNVHFDKILNDRRAVPKDTKVIKITYLHVSVNRIEVTSG